MNFRRQPLREEPEFNLIPLIDVLLVILLFLVAASTFNKFSELEVTLPKTNGVSSTSSPLSIEISVNTQNEYAINGQKVPGNHPQDITKMLQALKKEHDPLRVVLYADAEATHQTVMRALQAVQNADITEIHFATQVER